MVALALLPLPPLSVYMGFHLSTSSSVNVDANTNTNMIQVMDLGQMEVEVTLTLTLEVKLSLLKTIPSGHPGRNKIGSVPILHPHTHPRSSPSPNLGCPLYPCHRNRHPILPTSTPNRWISSRHPIQWMKSWPFRV